MRFELSRSAAAASLLAALTTQLFYGLALDAPEAANAAWMAAPMGLLLALPTLWLMDRLGVAQSRAFAALLFAGVALDAAGSIEWTAFSESCLAFDHISPVLLMIPLLLTVARCAWLGADAVGGAARFLAMLFALLMLMVVLYQIPYYRVAWLTPWLGAGIGGVLRSAMRAAGWNVLLCGAAMTACSKSMGMKDLLPGLMLSTGVAMLLIILQQMMAPVPVTGDVSRRIRIDTFLTNGRAPLYLQLPMIVAWFSGMLHLTAFESVAACCLFHRSLPKVRASVCVAAGLGIVFATSLLRWTNLSPFRQASRYLFHALTIAVILKGVFRRCGASPLYLRSY